MLRLTTSPGLDDREAFEQSFDFSKFPNLQTVEFRVRWMGGSLVFIPRALSTIKPATSPRLSIIQLNFSRPVFSNRSANALIEDAGDDLRSVAGEISRIEGELEGAVNLNVVWGQSFREALGALNVSFLFLTRGRYLETLFIWFHSFLTDLPTLRPLRWDLRIASIAVITLLVAFS